MRSKLFTLYLLIALAAVTETRAQWNINGYDVYYNGPGNVGIGITAPAGKFQVYGGNAYLWGLNLGYGTSLGVITTDVNFKPISFQINGTEYARIHSNGNFGIGTAAPSEKLEINGSAYTSAESAGFIADAGGQKRVGLMKYFGREAGIWRTSTQKFEIGRVDVTALPGTPTLFTTDLYVGGDGNIGIGTNDTKGYRFAVNGDAIFAKVKVKDPMNWPDYVFQKNYLLPPLNEVEQFIQQYQHLPDVPSAPEVQKKGLDLGDNQSVLLKKIEELTLYLIEQDKKLERLEREMDEFKKGKHL